MAMFDKSKFPNYLVGPLLDQACEAFINSYSLSIKNNDEQIILEPSNADERLFKKIYTKKLAHGNQVILNALIFGLPKKKSDERKYVQQAMNEFAHVFAHEFVKKAKDIINHKRYLIAQENKITSKYLQAHLNYEQLITDIKKLQPNSDERKEKRQSMLIARNVLDNLRAQSKKAKQVMHEYITYSDQHINSSKLIIE